MNYKILETLEVDNPWWLTGKVPDKLAPLYERPVLKKILSYLDTLERTIVIKGPRRTGKTSILYQIIKHLLTNLSVKPHQILFASCDDIELLKTPLASLLDNFQKRHRLLISDGGPYYVFLDEVHYMEEWALQVKKYFDRRFPIKFIVSGSSLSLIRHGAESLAGRTVEELILPFSFPEFVFYNSSKSERIKYLEQRYYEHTQIEPEKMLFDLGTGHVDTLKILWEDYIKKGGFPNLFEVAEESLWIKLLREDIVEKVIYRDMVTLEGIKKPQAMENLFLYITNYTSNLFNVTSVASSLGMNRVQIDKYLHQFEQAGLIFRMQKFSRSVETKLRSLDKVHVIDSGLAWAFGLRDMGPLAESVVARHFYSAKPCYWKEKEEVDIVIEDKDNVIPIEVKYKENVSIKELTGLVKFMERYKLKEGWVVIKDGETRIAKQGATRLHYIPAWKFCMLHENLPRYS